MIGTDAWRLLLEAGCAEPGPARDAWLRWRRMTDLEQIDNDSFQLLPAVVRRAEVIRDDPDRDRLVGIYRRCWAQNTLLYRDARDAAATLHDRGVPVALVGTAAMPRFYDGDVGARPVEVIELLTRPTHRRAATLALAGCGWSPSPDGWFIRDERRLRLRERAVPTSVGRHADDALWSSAVGADGAEPWSEPHPADLLLYLLLHGGDGEGWLADAYRIVTAQVPDLADLLVARARSHGVRRECMAALSTLAARSSAARLAPLLDALRSRRTGAMERLTATSGGGRAGRAARLLAAHAAGGAGPVRAVTSLVSDRLDLPHAARPALTVAHAALGRPAVVERLLGPLGAAPAECVPPLRAGTTLDFADVLTVLRYGAGGWREVTATGTHSRGTEARLVLPVAVDGPSTLRLAFAADQTAPVLVTVDGRSAALTPGRGGPAELTVDLAAPGTVHLALRSTGRRRLRPRPLFVVLRSITVR